MFNPENTPRVESFVNVYGRRTRVQYKPLKVLQSGRRRGRNIGEGSVYLVGVNLGGREKTFVIKHIRPARPQRGNDIWKQQLNELVSPRGILQKWIDLKEAGVNVSPTMRRSTSTKCLLMTDLTQNGSCEVLDIVRNKKFPDWFVKHRDNIVDQMVLNAEKAGNAGYLLSIDSYMVAYNPVKNEATAFVADLGKGVEKSQLASPGGNGFVVGYVLEKNNLLDLKYWNSRYPQHEMPVK